MNSHPLGGPPSAVDLVCLSHLRWDFVWQRPQHLLGRFAREGRVFFVEEPVFGAERPRLETRPRGENVTVAVPHLPHGLDRDAAEREQRRLLDVLLAEYGVLDFVLWYYTPMALAFTRHLRPLATVYDCMDELSAFRGAPPELLAREEELLGRADLVFTGGASLYEAKRGRHPGVHLFPSSIDFAHFARAREGLAEPADQAAVPRPRLGFFGVLDERLDAGLVRGVAEARPDWHLVLLGPVVKIDPAELPRLPNLHYPGPRGYAELPAWIAGWDVALLPFARNEATRFVSPTKTPEYLAAGRPVVSTPIHDVVRTYGEPGLVRIAATVEETVAAVEAALREDPQTRAAWLERVDAALARTSWERTWGEMRARVEEVVSARRGGVDRRERERVRPIGGGALVGAD
ncbi:MAG TPA: glycosyltransferase family 1 protein [Longimicrobium sp.]